MESNTLSSVVVLKLTRIPRFGSQDLRHSADATPANTGYTHTHTHKHQAILTLFALFLNQFVLRMYKNWHFRASGQNSDITVRLNEPESITLAMDVTTLSGALLHCCVTWCVPLWDHFGQLRTQSTCSWLVTFLLFITYVTLRPWPLIFNVFSVSAVTWSNSTKFERNQTIRGRAIVT